MKKSKNQAIAKVIITAIIILLTSLTSHAQDTIYAKAILINPKTGHVVKVWHRRKPVKEPVKQPDGSYLVGKEHLRLYIDSTTAKK